MKFANTFAVFAILFAALAAQSNAAPAENQLISTLVSELASNERMLDNAVNLLDNQNFVSSLDTVQTAVMDLTSEELKEKLKTIMAKVKAKASDLKKKVKAKMSD